MNGNRAGINKNAPLEAVSVAHKKKHDDGCRREKDDGKQPKKYSPDENVHTDSKIKKRKEFSISILLEICLFLQDGVPERRRVDRFFVEVYA